MHCIVLCGHECLGIYIFYTPMFLGVTAATLYSRGSCEISLRLKLDGFSTEQKVNSYWTVFGWKLHGVSYGYGPFFRAR